MSTSADQRNLTSSELQILKEFRKSINDVLHHKHDDNFLLRWLIARNFKLEDAEAMLRKNLDWRIKVKADSILQNYSPPEVLKKYWPLGFLGFDNEGYPVWLCRFGKIDMKGIIYSVKKSDIIMFYIYILELSELKMAEQTRKLGKLIDRHTFIFDLEDFTLQQVIWKPAFDLLTGIFAMYEDNYPERLKSATMINAPFVFNIALAILKPFFSASTFGKINIFGGKESWKNMLTAQVDPSVIPEHWGGTRVNAKGDPYCTDIVPAGGIVPASYYLQESQSFSNEDDVQTLEVGLKSVAIHEVYIPESESILQWEFKTDKHDIGFGLFYKRDEYNDKDLEEIIPISRVNCHLIPETGNLICDNEGTYVLKFDNSFSMLRSKIVRIRTEVIPPTTKL